MTHQKGAFQKFIFLGSFVYTFVHTFVRISYIFDLFLHTFHWFQRYLLYDYPQFFPRSLSVYQFLIEFYIFRVKRIENSK